MRCSKVPGCWRACAPDRANPQPDVTRHVKGAAKLQLAVEVAVVAELVSLVRDSPHQIRPALRMAPENEKSCPDILFRENVENDRCRLGIGSVVEGERHDFLLFALNAAERTTEQRAVSVKGSMHRAAQDRCSERGVSDHSRRPRTAV